MTIKYKNPQSMENIPRESNRPSCILLLVCLIPIQHTCLFFYSVPVAQMILYFNNLVIIVLPMIYHKHTPTRVYWPNAVVIFL